MALERIIELVTQHNNLKAQRTHTQGVLDALNPDPESDPGYVKHNQFLVDRAPSLVSIYGLNPNNFEGFLENLERVGILRGNLTRATVPALNQRIAHYESEIDTTVTGAQTTLGEYEQRRERLAASGNLNPAVIAQVDASIAALRSQLDEAVAIVQGRPTEQTEKPETGREEQPVTVVPLVKSDRLVGGREAFVATLPNGKEYHTAGATRARLLTILTLQTEDNPGITFNNLLARIYEDFPQDPTSEQLHTFGRRLSAATYQTNEDIAESEGFVIDNTKVRIGDSIQTVYFIRPSTKEDIEEINRPKRPKVQKIQEHPELAKSRKAYVATLPNGTKYVSTGEARIRLLTILKPTTRANPGILGLDAIPRLYEDYPQHPTAADTKKFLSRFTVSVNNTNKGIVDETGYIIDSKTVSTPDGPRAIYFIRAATEEDIRKIKGETVAIPTSTEDETQDLDRTQGLTTEENLEGAGNIGGATVEDRAGVDPVIEELAAGLAEILNGDDVEGIIRPTEEIGPEITTVDEVETPEAASMADTAEVEAPAAIHKAEPDPVLVEELNTLREQRLVISARVQRNPVYQPHLDETDARIAEIEAILGIDSSEVE